MAGAVMAMHPMLPNYTARYWKLNQEKMLLPSGRNAAMMDSSINKGTLNFLPPSLFFPS